MRITSPLVLATGLTTFFLAANAGAQTPPTPPPAEQTQHATPPAPADRTQPAPATTPAPQPARRVARPRWTLSGNGGVQFTGEDFETNTEFEAFDESATLTSAGELSSAAIFDAGITYALNEKYGVGVALSFYTSEDDVAVVATIPHPIFFDQVRVANYEASGAEHTSVALHLNGVWFVPFTTELDFAISAGPSIVFVKQDVVTAASLRSENPPFTDPVIDSVTLTAENKTAIGFNLGVDAIYAIDERYGIGVNARYLFAPADVDGLTDSMNVGGFQILGGIRVKF